MTKTELIQIIAGFVGTLGFTVLFNIRGKRLVFTSLGGFLSWTLFVIFSKFITNEPLNYFLVALMISIYAEVMARVLKSPTTTFITASLIPLIPGGSLYYTMADALSSNRESFIEKGIYTLQLASALALGIIVAVSFTKIINDAVQKRRSKIIRF